ncbi:hypothetical protein BASA60_004765 [Batrachochytrium salamandrivorans]|nr:hypothetical protein BASA60_004765 [Batrachochytrium salamandrivorans]
MFGPALTLVLALASSAVIAVPMSNNVYKRSAASLDPSSTELPFYFPESVYESIPTVVFDSYTDPFGITHVYGAHMINGASISNHQAAAHVNNGEVTSFLNVLCTDQHLAKRDFIVSAAEATVDFAKASATASAQLGIPVYSEFRTHSRVWSDATTGEVVQTVDFANKARTRSSQIPHRDPTEGVSTVSKPEFKRSSPNGWTAGKVTEVNLFYVSNVMHDITYQYGFTEKAGNFQNDNFNKGGQGNDAVNINVLNSRVVALTMESQIHEYAHGISNRLTGGSSTSGCLRTAEAQGMGEGWSDVMAMMVLAKSSDTATTSIPIGAYVKNTQSQSAGNIVAMKIIMGGLMLQPCNPSFLGARDAIIDADVNHYKGANRCEIYKGFAKRGFGLGATDIRTNDFSVPPECQ